MRHDVALFFLYYISEQVSDPVSAIEQAGVGVCVGE